MSIINQRQSLPLRSGSQDAPVGGAYVGPRRRSRSRAGRPATSGVPSVMGPPNRAPGVPVMGVPSPGGLRFDVMGGPDTGLRVDPMGGPDVGPRVDLMGESDLTFVDSLFGERKSFL
jgi:hypothetical protein